MLSLPRAAMLCLAAAAVLALAASSASSAPTGSATLQGPLATSRIQHLVVIQLENWSFDSLFGSFPGVDGLTPGPGTPTPLPQTDKLGTRLAAIPGAPPTCAPGTPPAGAPTATRTVLAGTPTPTIVPIGCFPPTLLPVPYDLQRYRDRTLHAAPDAIHEFFREQFQINNGRMDQFVAWNDIPNSPEFFAAGAMGYWDLNAIPTTVPSIGHYARNYTLGDKFHHAMFGASVPNWFMQICACVLLWPSPPASARIYVTLTAVPPVIVTSGPASSAAQVPNATGTPGMWYVVDNPPGPDPNGVSGPPPQTLITIGDRMDAVQMTWAWYWDASQNGVENFHAPWFWFANYARGTAAQATHVIGGTSPPVIPTNNPLTPTPLTRTPLPTLVGGPSVFLTAIKANTPLPQVTFIQPGTEQSLHPGNTVFSVGDEFVAGKLIPAIMDTPAYKANQVAILIVFDENGGRWDHVPPPRGTPFVTDAFGPGSRVPFIAISPWVRRCYVDYTYYDNTSVLAFITKNWGLTPVATRDAAANPLSGVFDFNQQPGTASNCTPTPATSPTTTATPSLTASSSPTSTPSAPPTPSGTPSPTVTLTAVAGASATPTGTPRALVPGENPPARTGRAGIPCASSVGQRCEVSGPVSGTLVKTGSMTFNLVAQAPEGTLVGGVPVIFLPTTAGNESFACSPVTAVLTATCAGSLVGDLLQGASVTVRLPHATLGVVEVMGSHVAPVPTVPAPPASHVGILVVPPLLPAPVPAPALVPLAPLPLIPPPGPLRPGGPPSFPEVPVIPEADTSTMLLAGLLAVAALIGIRPRLG